MAAVAAKEVKHLMRDRLTLGMIVGIPLLQILLFGYAINTDVRHLRAAVADQSASQLSRSLTQAAEATQVVDIVARVATPGELEKMLERGEISVGIYFPPDLERRIQQPDRANGQLLVDSTDPVLLGAVEPLIRLQRPEQTAPPDTPVLALRAYYNPERRSEVFVVPGLIGVILTMTMILFTAVSIVRERERGNLELLITMPVATLELMTAKILPYIAIGLIQVTLILGVGIALFDIPVRGSPLDLYLASVVFIAASLSLGLLISNLVSSQFQAMQMTLFVFLPSILLSGFMFPFEGMPKLAQWFAELFPLTHFVRLVRGIVLRGASLGDLHQDLWVLLGFTTLMMALAVLRFRKRLD
jgi:ABC-2 type transport system permease protein